MERVIKFPLPTYTDAFSNKERLLKVPFCLCYKYDMDGDFGPYGFETAKAKRLLEKTFGEVLCWDSNGIKVINAFENHHVGIFFYNKDARDEQLSKLCAEARRYTLAKKKNEILHRNNKQIVPLGSPPLLLNIHDKRNLYKSDAINHLLQSGLLFFIQKFYTPEAGQSFILFDESLVRTIESISSEEGIVFEEVESISKLNPW